MSKCTSGKVCSLRASLRYASTSAEGGKYASAVTFNSFVIILQSCISLFLNAALYRLTRLPLIHSRESPVKKQTHPVGRVITGRILCGTYAQEELQYAKAGLTALYS